VAFEFLEVAASFVRERFLFRDVHLAMQDVDAFDSQAGGLVNDRLDRNAGGAEVPVGVSGDGKFDTLPGFGIDRIGACAGPKR
jgi:hypothetical protein